MQVVIAQPDGIQFPFLVDPSIRWVTRPEVHTAIGKLESVGGWHVKQQLTAIDSALAGCDYKAIAAPFRSQVDLLDARFMNKRGFPANTKSAFLLALRNALVPAPPDQDQVATDVEALVERGWVQRYVRDSEKARTVKAWYGYQCQLDCETLRLPRQEVGEFRRSKHLPLRVRRISRRASSNYGSYGVGR